LSRNVKQAKAKLFLLVFNHFAEGFEKVGRASRIIFFGNGPAQILNHIYIKHFANP
jgi:hypothetical protein